MAMIAIDFGTSRTKLACWDETAERHAWTASRCGAQGPLFAGMKAIAPSNLFGNKALRGRACRRRTPCGAVAGQLHMESKRPDPI